MNVEQTISQLRFLADQTEKYAFGDEAERYVAFTNVLTGYTNLLSDICENPELKVDLALKAAENAAVFKTVTGEAREKFQG